MKITVFGFGYVGLIQGMLLANAGRHIVCVDIDAHKAFNLKPKALQPPTSHG